MFRRVNRLVCICIWVIFFVYYFLFCILCLFKMGQSIDIIITIVLTKKLKYSHTIILKTQLVYCSNSGLYCCTSEKKTSYHNLVFVYSDRCEKPIWHNLITFYKRLTNTYKKFKAMTWSLGSLKYLKSFPNRLKNK